MVPIQKVRFLLPKVTMKNVVLQGSMPMGNGTVKTMKQDRLARVPLNVVI